MLPARLRAGMKGSCASSDGRPRGRATLPSMAQGTSAVVLFMALAPAACLRSGNGERPAAVAVERVDPVVLAPDKPQTLILPVIIDGKRATLRLVVSIDLDD